MKDFPIKITVPTSLADIKLKDYQKYRALDLENLEPIFLRQKIVQIFCNITLLAVTRMSMKDFTNISNQILSILATEELPLKPITKLDGIEYGFIPMLSQKTISVAEYVDLDMHMREWDTFHKAIAIMYRPITSRHKDRYLIEPYEANGKYEQEMLNIGMDVVLGAVVFFWNLNKQLLTITPSYLQRHLQKNPEVKAVLEKSGVGINTYINLLTEACSKLERLLPYPLEKPYTS